MQQGLCSKAGMRWTATLGPARLTPRAVPFPHILGHVRRYHGIIPSGTPDKPAFPSFDSEDELDRDLTEEFAKVINPKKMQQVAAHLDLAWSIRKNRKRVVCDCCKGSGEGECKWCHGTGFSTVGDKLLCASAGNCDCVVCKGKGYVKCDKCRGTGYRAGWLEQGYQP